MEMSYCMSATVVRSALDPTLLATILILYAVLRRDQPAFIDEDDSLDAPVDDATAQMIRDMIQEEASLIEQRYVTR
jgi:hypothetical protein